jgi:hypothetical protein
LPRADLSEDRLRDSGPAQPRGLRAGAGEGGRDREGAGAAAQVRRGDPGRRAGIVRSQRGADGGYALAKPAGEITIGAVLRAVDGPLAEVRGLRPHETEYSGVASHLPEVWIAVRASLRKVLDETTLAQVLSGELPAYVRTLNQAPDAWLPR